MTELYEDKNTAVLRTWEKTAPIFIFLPNSYNEEKENLKMKLQEMLEENYRANYHIVENLIQEIELIIENLFEKLDYITGHKIRQVLNGPTSRMTRLENEVAFISEVIKGKLRRCAKCDRVEIIPKRYDWCEKCREKEKSKMRKIRSDKKKLSLKKGESDKKLQAKRRGNAGKTQAKIMNDRKIPNPTCPYCNTSKYIGTSGTYSDNTPVWACRKKGGCGRSIPKKDAENWYEKHKHKLINK